MRVGDSDFGSGDVFDTHEKGKIEARKTTEKIEKGEKVTQVVGKTARPESTEHEDVKIEGNSGNVKKAWIDHFSPSCFFDSCSSSINREQYTHTVIFSAHLSEAEPPNLILTMTRRKEDVSVFASHSMRRLIPMLKLCSPTYTYAL